MDRIGRIMGVFSCAAALLAGAEVSLAQDEGAPRAQAPDVIVSTIGGSSLTKNGTSGGITAYSVTTVSCNIGNLDAIWFNETQSGHQSNEHPVIGQQLYRYKQVNGAGRMEQIGMSWLKHGFDAADAQGANCGTCSPNPSDDWLAPGCTDTYSASLNGQQGNLGPRSEINAATGAYPYPFCPLGAPCQSFAGSSIARRLQVANADLDPAQNSGASYLTEVHYLTTDEPGYNTHYNNTSYRSTTVGTFDGSGYPLSLTGSTVQQKSAIEAWPLLESGAQVVSYTIPGEGRYVLGYKATSIGGGVWRYEYALYNMNSDRSAGSFSVAMGAGVCPTNVGFHDVNYHSGEPYAGTDWATTRSTGALTWATQSYNTNQNANALRWSTTYNFRFDALSAPTTGIVTVGLFKPGTPTEIAFNVQVPSSPSCVRGDVSGNGIVNGVDVTVFTNLLVFGVGTAQQKCAGDLEAIPDCAIDMDDVPNFVNCVMSGGCP